MCQALTPAMLIGHADVRLTPPRMECTCGGEASTSLRLSIGIMLLMRAPSSERGRLQGNLFGNSCGTLSIPHTSCQPTHINTRKIFPDIHCWTRQGNGLMTPLAPSRHCPLHANRKIVKGHLPGTPSDERQRTPMALSASKVLKIIEFLWA